MTRSHLIAGMGPSAARFSTLPHDSIPSTLLASHELKFDVAGLSCYDRHLRGQDIWFLIFRSPLRIIIQDPPALMPGLEGVCSGRHLVDFEAPILIGDGEIRMLIRQDVSSHVGMRVARDSNHAGK